MKAPQPARVSAKTVSAKTEQRLRRGDGDEIVVLADGDPLETPQADAAGEWDWDAEAVSADRHCAACGTWGPVFRLADGNRVCAACAHGDTLAQTGHDAPADL